MKPIFTFPPQERRLNNLSIKTRKTCPNKRSHRNQYDVQNNLTRVDHYGGAKGTSPFVDHVRVFAYDALARLLSSTNADSGAAPSAP
jgi:hypothetical protein